MKTSLSSFKAVKIQVLLILIMATLFEIPRYFEYRVHEYYINNKHYYIMLRTALWENDLYQILFRSLLVGTMELFIPILLTGVLTGYLIKAINERRKTREELFLQRNRSETMTFVLTVIAASFVLLNLPRVIYPILRAGGNDLGDGCDQFYTYFALLSDTISALNSAINIFIFYPYIPRFRTVFKGIFEFERSRKISPSSTTK